MGTVFPVTRMRNWRTVPDVPAALQRSAQLVQPAKKGVPLMTYRPTDPSGDILPVLTISDMFSGAEAVARLVNDRLNLLTGDWWENPTWGCSIVQQLQESRLTGSDIDALSSYLTAYVRETPGVRDVRDVHASVEGSRFSWICAILTDAGPAEISYVTS